MNFARTTLAALLLAAAATAHAVPAPDAEDRRPNENEELAIAALEGLMQQSPERSLPILKKVLAGPQSALVKRRALFVLGQIDGPEAREILLQSARTNSELRGEAIRSIGIAGDPVALDALKPVYMAGDESVKKDVMQAWVIAEHKSAVYDVALNAKTESEASEAIKMLGVMGAKEELRKLGNKPNATRGLIEAYALSDDLDSLRKIAEGTGDKSLRADAVQQIGIIDNDAGRAALREIYAKATEKEIKDAALHGMMIADDDKGILALYRVAKTTDEKRALLRMLTTMDSDLALEVIDETLEKK
jgi:HEAT repeat protein